MFRVELVSYEVVCIVGHKEANSVCVIFQYCTYLDRVLGGARKACSSLRVIDPALTSTSIMDTDNV